MLKRLILTVVLAASPAFASAQVTPAAGYTPPDDTQSVKVGAVIFYDYTFTKTPQATDAAGHQISPSAFSVPRTYINVTGNISHNVAFRITPDVSRESGTGSSLSGSYTFRMKYGYAQFNLDDWTGNWKQTWVRVGIQQTPFIDAQESAYRYRFQGTTFIERDGGLSSSDAGISAHTNLPNNYGDLHVGYYNGEGYGRAEVNDQKAWMIRGTLRPFPGGTFALKGLRLTGGLIADHAVQDAPRRRVLAGALYEYKRFNAGFDVIALKDKTLPTSTEVQKDGWSAWVTPFFKEKSNGLEAIVRYDSFRQNKVTTPDARQNRTLAGLAWWFPHPGGNATAALLLDFEQVAFQNYTGTVPAKQQRLALHGLINF